MSRRITDAAERSIVGNLYKGRISRVLPGMQAAFVDVGLDRGAFLYVDDGAEALEEEGLEPGELPSTLPIQDVLRENQEIVVQITRELGSAKGPRATSYVTLPGRYLVLLPQSTHIGVSRRITDQAERERLRSLLAEVAVGGGVIVRTAGEGRDRADFLADYSMLQSMWRHVSTRGEEVCAPCLLHRDLDQVLLWNPGNEIYTASGWWNFWPFWEWPWSFHFFPSISGNWGSGNWRT